MTKAFILKCILLGCLALAEAGNIFRSKFKIRIDKFDLIFLYVAWEDPFFSEGGRDDVVIAKSGNPTVINMDEEILAPIVIAVLSGYKGSLKPDLGSFDFGSNFDLGLDFEKNAIDEWNMVVTKKQDYEQVNMQLYVFYVQAEGQNVMVQIRIANTFDNAPVMTSLTDTQCIIKELQPPDYQSPCEFVSEVKREN